jgi:peptidyl-prolyl cis-trans isomerase SurA
VRAAAAIALVCAGAAVAAGDPSGEKGAGGAKSGPKAALGAVAAIDRPAAIVGTAVIWRSQIEERLRGQPGQDARQVLEEMIDTELIVQAAIAARIDVEAREVDLALDEIKKANNLDDASLDAVLGQQGFTRAMYRDDLARQIQVLRFVNGVLSPRVVVSDEDVAKEVARRGAGADKDVVKRELRQQQLEKVRLEWLKEQRRRVHIERRP